MPWLALHFQTVHKILYCSSSVNTWRHSWGNFSAGKTSPTAQVLCLYSFPGDSHTVRMTVLCGALPHRAFQIPFSIRRGHEGHLILPHCTPSHGARGHKGRTSNSHMYYYGITMPSPSGPQHRGHCLRSNWPWEEAMQRGRCQTTIFERPLASPHLHCWTLVSTDWRLAAGEITELTDAYRQWRVVTPGGGISSQVEGVSVSPQSGCQVVCRQL